MPLTVAQAKDVNTLALFLLAGPKELRPMDEEAVEALANLALGAFVKRGRGVNPNYVRSRANRIRQIRCLVQQGGE